MRPMKNLRDNKQSGTRQGENNVILHVLLMTSINTPDNTFGPELFQLLYFLHDFFIYLHMQIVQQKIATAKKKKHN